MLDKITTIGLVLGITILAFVADGLKALIEKEVWETSTQ